MRIGLGIGMRKPSGQTLVQRAINLLRSKGADAHLWDFSSFREAYGAEFVGTVSGFTTSTNWSVVGESLVSSGANAFASAYKNISMVAATTYRVSFRVTRTAGSLLLRLGDGTNRADISASGTYTYQLVSGGSHIYFLSNASGFEFVGTIDNISVREVLSASPGTTLPNVLYQDSAGTTPVTAPDQPIGLCLDSMGVLGSELVVNGTFDANVSGWTPYGSSIVTWDAGRLRLEVNSGNIASQPVTTVPGRWYRVDWNGTSGTGIPRLLMGTAVPNGNLLAPQDGAGVKSAFFLATTTVAHVQIATSVNTDGLTAFFDNISVREISGIHAAQSTSAKKPTLRRGVVNRLLQSENLTTWATIGCTVTGGQSDPDGGLTAFKLVCTTGGDQGAYNSAPVVSGVTYTESFWVRADAPTNVSVNTTAGGFGAGLAHSVTTTWTKVSGTVTASGAGSLWIKPQSTTPVYVWHPQLETGSIAGDYAPTTSAPASSSQGRYWAEFDGTDDALTLGSVPFQMADDFAIVASTDSVPSSAAWKTVFGVIGSTPTPRIQILSTSGVLKAYLRDDASTSIDLSSSYPMTATTVSTLSSRVPARKLRGGGADLNSNSATLSTTTLLNAYIGWLGVGGDPFNGGISSVSAIKSTLTDAELLLIEKMAASKAGLSI